MVTISRIKIIFSAEFFYVMFLFSGAFKESFDFPFDLAALFLVLAFISSLIRFIKHPVISKYWVTPIVFLISLLGIILLSSLVNGMTASSMEKIIKFVALTMPTYLLPLVFVRSRESLINILKSISILAVLLSIFSLPMIFNKTGLFIGFNDGNYQGLARTVGIGFLALTFFFLISDKKGRILVSPFLLLVSFTLISTGSRMPLLAIVIVALYALYKSIAVKKGDILVKKTTVTGLSLVVFLSLFIPYLYSKGYFQTIVYRFQVLFEGGGASTTGRTMRIQSAIDMFRDNFMLGGGFGNFGDYYSGTEGVYAHNIFLEFLSELGLIGVLWCITFFIFVFYRSVSVYKNKGKTFDGLQVTLISCFLFFLLNAMVSGNINDNRAIFTFLSLMVISPFIKSQKISRTKNIKAQ